MAADGTVDRRQLALDAGRAGLAARPRRQRARRPLQRAAAAAARRLRHAMELGPVSGARGAGAASLPLPDLRGGPALRPGSSAAEVRPLRPRGGDPGAARPDPRARPARGRAQRPAAVGDARSCASPSARAAARRSSSTPTMHARECPFCASPIVTDTGVEPPDQAAGAAALPALARRRRATAMNGWLGRLWFAPVRPQGTTPAPTGRCRASTSPTGPTTPRPQHRLHRPARHRLLRDPAGDA